MGHRVLMNGNLKKNPEHPSVLGSSRDDTGAGGDYLLSPSIILAPAEKGKGTCILSLRHLTWNHSVPGKVQNVSGLQFPCLENSGDNSTQPQQPE